MNAVLLALLLQPQAGVIASVNKGEDSVSLLSVATGSELAKIPTGSHPQEVVFTPSGRTAVISNMGKGGADIGRTLTLVDVRGRKGAGEVQLGDHGAPHGLAVLSEDRILFTSHATDSLVEASLSEKKVIRSLPTGGKGTHLVVLSPDKKIAYTVNVFTQDVSMIDLQGWRLVKKIPCGARAEGIAASPDGKWITVGNVGDNTVTVIDAQKQEAIATLGGLSAPIRTFFSSDSSRFFVSCAGTGELVAFEAKSRKELRRINISSQAPGLTLTAGTTAIPMNFDRHGDGRHIFVVLVNANAIAMVDGMSMSVVKTFKTGVLPDGMAWSSSAQG